MGGPRDVQYAERLRQFYHLLVRVTAAASHAFRVHHGVVRASNFGFWNFVFTLSYRHAARTVRQACALPAVTVSAGLLTSIRVPGRWRRACRPREA